MRFHGGWLRPVAANRDSDPLACLEPVVHCAHVRMICREAGPVLQDPLADWQTFLSERYIEWQTARTFAARRQWL